MSDPNLQSITHSEIKILRNKSRIKVQKYPKAFQVSYMQKIHKYRKQIIDNPNYNKIIRNIKYLVNSKKNKLTNK